MQVDASRYDVRSNARSQHRHSHSHSIATAHQLFLGHSLPEHDEEIAILHTPGVEDRIVWKSGLDLTTAEMEEKQQEDESDEKKTNDATSHNISSTHHAWSTRIIKSLQFPAGESSIHEISSSLTGLHSVEAMIRGGSSASKRVLTTCWATFSDFHTTTPEPQLCVLQEECITIVDRDGEIRTVQLPCRAHTMWPMLEGIMIERIYDDATDNPPSNDPLLSEYDDLSGTTEQPNSAIPVYFSLLHPLEELKPVSSMESISVENEDDAHDIIDEDDFIARFVNPTDSWLCDSNERTVWTSTKQPFVVTWNRKTKKHSLWLVRQSSKEVVKRRRVDGDTAAAEDENDVDHILDSASALHDTSMSTVSSHHSSKPSSRRQSGAWHASHPRHTPTHPSHTSALSQSKANGQDFYQTFLQSTLKAEDAYPTAQPSYHDGGAGAAANEPDDDAIHTELLLERSWIQDAQVDYPCTSVFLSCDDANEPLLCMFTDTTSTLEVYRLTSSLHPTLAMEEGINIPRIHLTPYFTSHFLSAIPIYNAWHTSEAENMNPYNYSICTLEMNGACAIYVGEKKVTHVDITFGKRPLTPLTAASSSSTPPMNQRTVSLKNPLMSGVNLERGAATRIDSTPMKSHDQSFSSTVSFTPLDPSSSAAAVFFSHGSPIYENDSVAGSPGFHTAATSPPLVKRLLEPVSNRFTLELQDGSLYRVSLPTRYLSTLVHTCMNSLACSLSSELMCTLRSDLVRLRTEVCKRRNEKTSTTAGSASSIPSDSDEWEAFVILMRHFFGCLEPSTSSKTSAVVPSGDDAWKRLLSSRYHHTQSRNSTLSALTRSQATLPVSYTTPTSPQFALSNITFLTSTAAFLAELPQLFACLHLVYEELKIAHLQTYTHTSSSSCTSSFSHLITAPSSAHLACFVLKYLALTTGRREYLDVYERELGNSSLWSITQEDAKHWSRMKESFDKRCEELTAIGEASSVLPSVPPSIHAFLLARLRNSSTPLTSSQDHSVYPLPILPSSSHTHNFLLNYSFNEPFAWSRKLLLFYDLLTRSNQSETNKSVGSDQSAAMDESKETMVVRVEKKTATTSSHSLLPPSHHQATHVHISEYLPSPYALSNIEQKQIEVQQAQRSVRAISSRIHSAVVSTAATPAATPSIKQLMYTPATPNFVSQSNVASASNHLLALSPLLTSPFTVPMSPFHSRHNMSSIGSTTAVQRMQQQQRRVQMIQIQVTAASAVKASRSTAPSAAPSVAATPAATPMRLYNTNDSEDDAHHHLLTPSQLGSHRVVKKKNRVSFGANTTVGTTTSAMTNATAASMRMASVAMDFPIFAPSSIRHVMPLFLSHSSAESVVLAMVSEEFTLDHLSTLSFGIALPLLECLKHVREHPPVNLQTQRSSSSDVTGGVISSWPREAYLLIGREDLGKMFTSLHSTDEQKRTYDKSKLLDEELEITAGRPSDTSFSRTSTSNSADSTRGSAASAEQTDADGTLVVERNGALRFGQDMRMKEVRHLLRSDRVLCVSLDSTTRAAIEAGAAESSVETQVRLHLILTRRALTLPIARGMLTYASLTPVLTEPLSLPPLVLRGRVPPLNTHVELDMSPGNPTMFSQQVMNWPEFHNGVAAALRVTPNQMQSMAQAEMSGQSSFDEAGSEPQDPSSSSPAAGITSSNNQITRTWIMYNRPTAVAPPPSSHHSNSSKTTSLTHSHAGFLYGLGLNGHLSCLSTGDLFWYLSQNHTTTTVAILLGMSAAKRGTMDTTVSKMLALHIPALLPSSFSEMNIPSVVQSSALVGVGLLYQSSCYRLMAEILLGEIGRRSDRFKSATSSLAAAAGQDDSFLLERENYSLSAGFGLGLLLLGRGSDATAMSGLIDLNIEKHLSLYIHGGLSASAKTGSGAGGSSGAASADDINGGVEWMAGSSSTRRTAPSSSANPNYPNRSQANQSAASAASSRNVRIKEGNLINVDVTSPGATLALGFMYLQSNSTLISSRLTIPDTHFSLDYVRSDFVWLRILAKHLIMWRDIPSTLEEVCECEMNDLLKKYVLSVRYYMPNDDVKSKQKTKQQKQQRPAADIDEEMKDDDEDEEDNEVDIDAELEGDAEEDEDDSLAFSTPPSLPSSSCSSDPKNNNSNANDDIDYVTLRQNYVYVLTANCFAMGLKYAGTSNSRILRVLLRVLYALRTIARRRGGSDMLTLLMNHGLHPQAQLHKLDRGTIESSLCTVSLSIALLMSGSGNLTCFKLFRRLLKQRPEKNTQSGWYQIMSMCIGMLFLGGGKYTFNTSSSNQSAQSQQSSSSASSTHTRMTQSSIAYLVIACYPHLMQSLDEQRYYLQLYRHFYVLAMEQRGLETIDVDTGKVCYVPLEVIVEEGEKRSKSATSTSSSSSLMTRPKLKRLRFVTPCLLPSYDTIHRISIVSPRFHALSLQLKGGSDSSASSSYTLSSQLHRIYVKKKLGYESYEKDPRGLCSIQSRIFPYDDRMVREALGDAGGDSSSTSSSSNSRFAFLQSFSTDPRLLSFTHLFIRDPQYNLSLPDGDSSKMDTYLSMVLYECLQEEKFGEMIQIYLQLFPLANETTVSDDGKRTRAYLALESQLSDVKMIHSLLLLKQYYESVRRQNHQSATSTSPSSHGDATASNHSVPFHSLPRSEGSADVEIADSSSDINESSSSTHHRLLTKPLMSLAFLDAILSRVECFFIQHKEVQAAFSTSIKQLANQSDEKVAMQQQMDQKQHALLGSLLQFWCMPDTRSLHTGLRALRQYAATTQSSNSSATSSTFTPSPLQLIVAGLIWPQLQSNAIQAILRAIQ